MAFRSEDPPNSRLFILCQKGITEKAFKDKFGEYGKVDDIWIVKDKRTNEDRGIVYIKFGKTSEAMLAMEEMNGRCMAGQPKPLKVVVANSKRDGSTRDPREEEKLVRLFVICPKSFTEKDLRGEFEKFGDLDHVTVIKDRSTGESKGFGYVKYHRAYHAALAYENCDQGYKPKFAEPQRSRDDNSDYYNFGYKPKFAEPQRSRDERDDNSDFYSFGGGFRGNDRTPFNAGQKRSYESDGSYYTDPRPPLPPPPQLGQLAGAAAAASAMMNAAMGPMSMLNEYPVQSNCCRIQIVAPIGMTQGYLSKLFNIIPGMEYCDLNESTGVAFARYATPQCAQYARDKLHGFEYPIGSQLMVQLAEENIPPSQDLQQQNFDHSFGMGPGKDINDLRQKAASLLEKAGINPSAVMQMAASVGAMGGMGGGGIVGPDGVKMERVNYCNIMLPLPQPLVPDDSNIAQRLFIVCQPSAVSERILRDAFSRFGNLIDVFLLSGRNYGYAKYASKESAMKAIQMLHGQNLSGQRIKVLEAEPPKTMAEDGPSKKQKL